MFNISHLRQRMSHNDVHQKNQNQNHNHNPSQNPSQNSNQNSNHNPNQNPTTETKIETKFKPKIKTKTKIPRDRKGEFLVFGPFITFIFFLTTFITLSLLSSFIFHLSLFTLHPSPFTFHLSPFIPSHINRIKYIIPPSQFLSLIPPNFELPLLSVSSMWKNRPKTADQMQSKVSFSDSSKSDSDKQESGRPSSATASHTSSPPTSQSRLRLDSRSWQRVNRQSQALWL